MRKKLKLWAFLFSLILQLSVIPNCLAAELRVLTEDFPPYSYLLSGKPYGISVEIVKSILSDMGKSAEIEFMPWDYAYALGLKESNIALFSAWRTPARENLFRWVGPIAHEEGDLYIALSKDTPDPIVASWQASLDKIKSNGTLNHILKKYSEGLAKTKIQKPSNWALFKKIAKAQGMEAELAKLARKQSFQFRRFKPSKNLTLGSSSTELGRSKDEEAHTVSLNASFEIQQTPVTQLQWSLLMANNPSEFKKDGLEFMNLKMNPNRPVEQVSWLDVQKFIQKINELDPAYRYRLPTEAEWEYAARAGTNSAYSFGDDPKSLGEYGWYSENSGKRTHDVASLKPNPAGIFDMHGNVWEWVSDWYAEHYSGGESPIGPENGADRVIRGGSWNMAAENLRSARRQKDPPSFSSSRIGFRLVRFAKRKVDKN